MVSLIISIADKQLWVLKAGKSIASFDISTAANGVGEREGSYQTPRGRHIISAKIGANQPIGTIFIRRRPVGGIFSPEMLEEYPQRDWILTRILWLSGCVLGFNRLGQVDTMRRYIYIHGVPDERPMKAEISKGCINMRNKDIVTLFDLVSVYDTVDIFEGSCPQLNMNVTK